MTNNEIIKAVAELDGWRDCYETEGGVMGRFDPACAPVTYKEAGLEKYLTSRDAIVLVCEKQPQEIRDRISLRTTIFSTASEIAIVLLEESGHLTQNRFTDKERHE